MKEPKGVVVIANGPVDAKTLRPLESGLYKCTIEYVPWKKAYYCAIHNLWDCQSILDIDPITFWPKPLKCEFNYCPLCNHERKQEDTKKALEEYRKL